MSEMIMQRRCGTCKHEVYCNWDIQCFGTNKENWEPKQNPDEAQKEAEE